MTVRTLPVTNYTATYIVRILVLPAASRPIINILLCLHLFLKNFRFFFFLCLSRFETDFAADSFSFLVLVFFFNLLPASVSLLLSFFFSLLLLSSFLLFFVESVLLFFVSSLGFVLCLDSKVNFLFFDSNERNQCLKDITVRLVLIMFKFYAFKLKCEFNNCVRRYRDWLLIRCKFKFAFQYY